MRTLTRASPHHLVSDDPADFRSRSARTPNCCAGARNTCAAPSATTSSASCAATSRAAAGRVPALGHGLRHRSRRACTTAHGSIPRSSPRRPRPTRADENISFERMCEIVGAPVAEALRSRNPRDVRGSARARLGARTRARGHEGFEFGTVDGALTLIDGRSRRIRRATDRAEYEAGRLLASTSSSCAIGSTAAAGTTSRRRPLPDDVVRRTRSVISKRCSVCPDRER